MRNLENNFIYYFKVFNKSKTWIFSLVNTCNTEFTINPVNFIFASQLIVRTTSI